jgi:hypothetical protein
MEEGACYLPCLREGTPIVQRQRLTSVEIIRGYTKVSTVISSSDSSNASNRTLATSFSAILFANVSAVIVPESSVLIGHVGDGCVHSLHSPAKDLTQL